MKRIFIISILFLAFLFPLTAERRNENNDYYNRAIGGKFVGLPNSFIGGITYQQWLPNDMGFEVAVGFVSNENTAYYNFEGEFQKLLFVDDFGKRSLSSLYLWANAGLNSLEEIIEESSEENNYNEKISIHPNFFVGVGFGMEMTYFEHFSVPVTLGFEVEFPREFAIGFTAGIGLRYRF